MKTTTRFVLLLAVNIFAVAVLLAFTGAAIANAGVGGSSFLPDDVASPDGNLFLQLVLAIVFVLAAIIWFRGLFTNPAPRRGIRLIFSFLIFATLVCGASAFAALITETSGLESPAWAYDHGLWLGLGLLGSILIIGALALLPRKLRYGGEAIGSFSRWAGAELALRTVQVVGLLAIVWATAFIYDALRGTISPSELVNSLSPLFFSATLVALLVANSLIDRASPHHAYRDLLSRCFAVIRTADGRAARVQSDGDVLLSRLTPTLNGQGRPLFPELLICGAVNLSDVGDTPAGSNALSIVFSPSEIRIPAIPAAVSTLTFDRYLRRRSLRGGWKPVLSLSTAIAITGAAVSPAMGKYTRRRLRALFAALNIRLGVWIPNVLNETGSPAAESRDQDGQDGNESFLEKRLSDLHDTGRAKFQAEPAPHSDARERVRVSVGIRGLICELFGFHSKHADLLYATDGGHYENLGLIELLKRRCSVIWCVDGSGDPPGRANALAETILLASGELGVDIDLDLARFELSESAETGAGPILRETYAIGRIMYTNPSDTGTLVVVKLGLTERSPIELREYRRRDRKFPHHSTLRQLFKAERFDAYQRLGKAATQEALNDPSVASVMERTKRHAPSTRASSKRSHSADHEG